MSPRHVKDNPKNNKALDSAVRKIEEKAKAKGVEPPRSVGREIYKGRISNAKWGGKR